MTNRIDFQISDSDNAEYYLIRCIGPQNPGYGNSTETTVLAHAGYNLVEIPNPVNPGDPGVYEVHVYSVINGNETLSSCTESGTGEYLLVNYELYSQEKTFMPKLTTAYFDQRAVDLEVNFNDGSGWYRLKMSSGQAGEAGRTINCIGTNYMEYNKQKFHIYFQPPEGNEYCSYNVFSGGRDEVDVYIRTVAKPEYRYTTWPAQNSTAGNYIDEAVRYIYTNAASTEELPDGDIAKYWMENENTDSSNYDGMLKNKLYASAGEMASIGANDFGIVPDANPATQDYFFSPAVYRNYSIKASIEESMTSQPATGAYKPGFKAVGASTSILISDLDYPLEATYTIYYIQGKHLNENPAAWASVASSGNDCAITGLSTYTNYTLCVVASSNGVTSQYAYRLSHTAFNWLSVALDSPYDYASGAGFFMDSGYLTNSAGIPLSEGRHFTYGMPLDGDQFGLYGGGANIWDNGISGTLEAAKYLRMVHAGKNITDVSGLGIIPIAKDLPDFNISPAPVWDSANSLWRQTAYIDPERGSFVLPRPDFWYKCDNLDVLNPIIKSGTVIESNWSSTFLGITASTFGTTYKSVIYYLRASNGISAFSPYGTNPCPERLTISCWAALANTASTGPFFEVHFDSTPATRDYVSLFWNQSAWSHTIGINTTTVSTNNSFAMNGWRHVYILMDKNAGLTGGKSVRVFLQGTEYMYSTVPIQSLGYLYIRLGNTTGTTARAYLYDVKIWNSIVSEDPSWLFSNGTVAASNYIDDVLHPVYGAESGRKPSLNVSGSPSGGVGYYYVPQW